MIIKLINFSDVSLSSLKKTGFNYIQYQHLIYKFTSAMLI
jgi:hypothetical protein